MQQACAFFQGTTLSESGMILQLVVAFLLVDAILLCLLWLLLADELTKA